MKKYITYLLATALVGTAFVSCTERLQEGEMPISTHKVFFSTSDVATRTGLSIDGTTVTPDWNKTELTSIHLFEIDANDASAYGETIAITTSEDLKTAHFEADFPTNMSIIVDPSGTEGDGGEMGTVVSERVSPFRYAAIIAQKPDKNNLTFVVPSEQHPDAETLKDPDADFLIGYSRKAYDTEHSFDEPVVDLYFDRVAALGRLAISNFTDNGEKVQSVTINAQNGLTGCASYSDIDFENGTVNFVREEGPGFITLVYDGGMDIPASGPFYAYFVAIPGSATITSVEVLTNQYHYTKTINGGKDLTFSEKAFKSMNLDLSTAEKEEAAPSVPIYRKVTSTTDLVAGSQYLLVFEGDPDNSKEQNHDPKVFRPTLASNGNTFNKQTTDALAVEIVDGTITSDAYEACHFTLEDGYYLKADAVGMYIYPTGSSSGSGTLSAESSATNKLTISFNNGIAQIKAQSGTNYLVWSTSSYYFSSNANVEGDYSTGICLYVLDDGRQPQTLSFSPAANAEYDLHTSTWTVAVPTLNGAHTSVTYALSEDSNPSVATVDADGTVHPLSRGTVTIVATAEGNAQYRAASATYTLKVVDSSITINTYYKVTSTSDLETGAQYLLVYEGGSKVFKPILESSSSTTFSKSTDNALNAEISGGTISSNEFENCHLTLESGYYLKADAAGKYLYPDVASSRGVLSAESTASHSLNITIGNNGIASIITKTGTYYLVWSTSSNYFSSNTDVEGSYSTGICLYKLDDGRLPQTLSFSPTEVNYDMAGSAALVKPTLSNAVGTVTYSSSNEAIASVDASSGVVTVHGRGTVKITASATGNSQYKPGSVSYTLVISNSNAQTIRYVLANSIEAGSNYLIVSGGQALKNDGGNVASEAVTPSAGVIEIESGEETNLVWAAKAESGYTSNGHFSLSNGGYRMNRVSDNGNFSLSLVASTTAMDKYGVWDLQTYNGNTYLFHDSSSTMRLWVYYDGGWKVTYVQNSTNPSSAEKPTQLYMEEDNRQPQSLSFSASSATYDLSAPSSFVKPTLSTAIGTVTYSSSDTTIAEVDNSGNITGKKKGTVTITATATGNTEYRPGSASYTLTITNSSASTTTYYRASSIEAGKEYLVVSSGMALTNNNGIASTSVTVTNDAIELDDADAMLWTAEAKGSGFTLSNGGSFIQRASSNGTPSVGAAPSDNYYIWAYDNANQYMYTASGTKYYIYYSSNNNRWSQSSSASTSHTVTLYTSDPGSSSGGGDDPEPPTATTSTYTRISGDAELVTGTYLIVDKTNTYLFNASGTNHGGYSTIGSTSGITMSGLTITLTSTVAAESEFVLTRSGDNLTIKPVGGDNAGKYMYATNNVSSTYIDFQTAENNFVINSQSGDYVYFSTTKGTSTSEYLYKKSSDSFFKLGGSGAPGGEHAGIYLYKKVENP